jgi:hypothetical protein
MWGQTGNAPTLIEMRHSRPGSQQSTDCTWCVWYAMGVMEAAPGLEPGNNGFADRRLSHLATPPQKAGDA